MLWAGVRAPVCARVCVFSCENVITLVEVGMFIYTNV